jgi:hypothetical protein
MLRTTILVALAIAGGPAFSQICSVPPAQGLEGIGDGCTTYSAEVVFPNVGVFKSSYIRPATITMRAIRSSARTIPVRLALLRGNAQRLRFEVQSMAAACRVGCVPIHRVRLLLRGRAVGCVASKQRNMQNNAYTRSLALQQSGEADTCGTTPERSGLYASGLISQVNGAFAPPRAAVRPSTNS